jgi:aspartate ammonia-lyase
VGSSIMPGKVNPVIPEYLISSAHRIYANDQVVTSLSAQGCLELNAYLPEIGVSMIESLKLMISMNKSLNDQMLDGLEIDEDAAKNRLYMSPSVTTALSPLIGYHKAAELAGTMKESGCNVFEANEKLGLMDGEKMNKLMEPDQLLKKGFTMKDIRDLL